MQILENKALLLNLRDPSKVTANIPKSKELGDNKVVVKWGIDEVHALRSLNIKNIPSPILGQYDWPGQYTPFDHQKTTAAFLTMHQKAFCFNEQGTGKTGSVIWAADYLMKKQKIRRVLVICPLSIMDSAWRADLFKFAMHRTVDIAYGSAAKRRAIINGHAEFVIINFDGVEIVKEDIQKAGFDLVVVDEANAYKNAQTNRWKVLRSILEEDTWLWMLTGTPAAQSPVDAYGLAKLVNPNGVPRFFTSFHDMVMQKLGRFRYVPKESATATVYEALQPAIRFTKEECLDLPEMTVVTRVIELTKQQKKYYELLRKRAIIEADGEEVSAINAAVELNKLLQISCGAVYSDSGEVVEFDITKRYSVLKEVIDEASHKVLIFVPYKNVIALLSEKLLSDGITSEIINGDVPAGKRATIFQKFQEQTDPRALIIQPQAAAHGVTLTAADTVVWWGPVSSLETFAQANARVHRAGQRHPCTVVQLQGSPSEKHVYELLNKKIDVHSRIVELYRQIVD